MDRNDFADFPGWTPEKGTTRYGNPIPPDMDTLSLDDARQWGRKALDVLASSTLDQEFGQVDNSWLIDARRWTGFVFDAVTERIGADDVELRAYEAVVQQQFDAEIAEMRNSEVRNSLKPEVAHIDWRKEGF